MDLEKMQSTMQFLLEQQAKHDVIISQHHDRMRELSECNKILVALKKKSDERLKPPGKPE